jgi:signal peptidase II
MNLQFKFNEKVRLFFKKESIFSIIVIIIIFFLDRYSKFRILDNFSEETFYINNFINLDLIWNTGIGFGLLSLDSTFWYNLISLLIGSVILLLLYISFKLEKFERITFSIIIGGALGNFYDRIFLNAVPDFIDLHYNNFHWFTFNVADIFITVGIIGFLMKGFFVKNN